MKFLGKCIECGKPFDGEDDSEPGIRKASGSNMTTFYEGPPICSQCCNKYISGQKRQDRRVIQWPPTEGGE